MSRFIPLMVAAYAALINLIAFYTWRADKRFAVAGDRRVPETALLTLCALGGWPLAFIAAQMFRHKTRKGGFMAKVGLAIALNIVIICAIIAVFEAA